MPRVCLTDIAQKREITSTPVPQAETPNQTAQNNAQHVIPVEKLKGKSRGEFHGVRPRPPAQHAEDHERQRNSVRFWLIHVPPIESRLGASNPQPSGTRAAGGRVLAQTTVGWNITFAASWMGLRRTEPLAESRTATREFAYIAHLRPPGSRVVVFESFQIKAFKNTSGESYAGTLRLSTEKGIASPGLFAAAAFPPAGRSWGAI